LNGPTKLLDGTQGNGPIITVSLQFYTTQWDRAGAAGCQTKYSSIYHVPLTSQLEAVQSLTRTLLQAIILKFIHDIIILINAAIILLIWKSRECLNLLPNSRDVQAKTDIIDALTVRCPDLGVNILPACSV
jgi:hypothetical protein